MNLANSISFSIQQIPGVSDREKKKWIATEIKEQIKAGRSLEEIVGFEKFPKPLSLIIRVEAAKILHRFGHPSQANNEAITDGLRSEIGEVVTRALKANHFFDGSNPDLNVDFFLNQLFPHVSYWTRCKIIKKLARGHSQKKNFEGAEQFFKAIFKVNGVTQAMPLLMSCPEEFIRKIVFEHQVRLTENQLKVALRKNLSLVVWYLKLSDPTLVDPMKRFNNQVFISSHTTTLAQLIIVDLQSFIEIYELHGEKAPALSLSKDQTRFFRKHAREAYLNKPKIFFKLLKLEEIEEKDLEKMFPKIFPDIYAFNLSYMLQKLKHYPKEKRAKLLLDSYKAKYGKSLLDDKEKITKDLMRILPADERIKQARLKIQKQNEEAKSTENFGSDRWRTYLPTSSIFPEDQWKVYLPTSEVLPDLKAQLANTSDMYARARLVFEMIHCCEVNEDDDSLLELLKYIRERHANEIPEFHHLFIHYLQSTLDTRKLSEAHWDELFKYLQRMWIKIEVSDFQHVSIDFLESALEFKLKNGQNPELLLEWIFYVATRGYSWQKWNFFKKSSQFERSCLITFLSIAEKTIKTDKCTEWIDRTVSNLLGMIHEFNERQEKLAEDKRQQLIPMDSWIVENIERMIKKNPNNWKLNSVKSALLKDYKSYIYIQIQDLYYKHWPNEKDLLINDSEIVNDLKKNYSNVLINWEKYFDICSRKHSSSVVHRFLNLLRWHNELPGRFIEKCVRGIKEEQKNNLLVPLALLVDGTNFAEFIEPLLPTEKQINIADEKASEKFSFIHHVTAGMKLASPPVPLELIQRLCAGDYLSSALTALNSSCRRSTMTRALPFAAQLATQRVSVAKHGVRLMSLLASIDQLSDFLFNTWQQQKHYSVRQILLTECRSLFAKSPGPATWSLMKTILSTIANFHQLSEWNFTPSDIPNEYVTEFMKLELEMIDRLATSNKLAVNMYYSSFLRSIDQALCTILPADFLKQLLKRFLFDNHDVCADATRELLLYQYLNDPQLSQRLDVFAEIFLEAVQSNTANRKAIRAVITKIVTTKFKPEFRSLIIERTKEVYQSVLSNFDDPKSYILLVFAQEWVQAENPKVFGRILAEKLLPELFQLYTPWFSYYIIDGLKEFLKRGQFEERKTAEAIREILEVLVEFNTVESIYTAAQLIVLLEKQDEVRNYRYFFEKLSDKTNHPAVKSLVNSFKK